MSRRENFSGLGGQGLADREPTVAVLIPCFNEATTIGQCVGGFRASLPNASIYVYDNNSTDGTADVAAAAGAIVRRESLQGKGNVVRRMFADVDADIYVIVDGDATYDPSAAPAMVRAIHDDNLDMVVARRVTDDGMAYRSGHRFGNRLFNTILRISFGSGFNDILSGYRAFSKRFVKSFPALSSGFDIEVELAIHTLGLQLPYREISVPYFNRPDGSVSKLNTWRDGLAILITIGHLFRAEKPLVFFLLSSILLGATSVLISIPVFMTYLNTGLVPRLPTALLSASLMTLAVLTAMCGVILDTVTRGRREMKRLFYLQQGRVER